MSALRNWLAQLSWRNTRDTFGLRAQLFHTIIGLSVLVMLVVGFSLDSWPDGLKNTGYIVHMGLGLWILLFSSLWFIHWIFQPKPARLPNQSVTNFRVAKLVHKLLLLLCIIMPVTGWIMASAWGNASFAIAPFIHVPAVTYKDPNFALAMKGLHIVVAWLIVGLLSLHISGAWYHLFIKRDGIVRRILPSFKSTRGTRHAFDNGVRKTKSML